ncbi:unnamed protein product, partial [Ranitomeya imitator]
MDPVKVQAIHDWTQPTSLKSLQKFLGFANFYRRFICNFSSIAKPLTDLTKKGADLVNWSSAAVEAFQELKHHFSSAPVLCQPDVSLPFQVEVDASEIGAGAVLSQRGSDCSVIKPCAFFSRKFSPAERNYDVGNRELLAMKWAFEEWRHWLEGAKHRVVVLIDHKNLTYLESAKRLNPRQARWSLFFARFDFVISYLPGSKNVKADALSRSFVPDFPGLSEPAGILKEGVIVSAISPDLRRVLQKFQANKPDRCPAEKLFVPDRWTNKVISEVHCSVLAGHPGIFGTRELVARSFWWPSLSRDVRTFVQSCGICARAKPCCSRASGLLLPLPVPKRPWTHISMDFISDLPVSQKMSVIWVVCDRFSKMVHLVPLSKLPSSSDLVPLFFQHVVRLHGIPENIVSDRGSQFVSRFWRAFCGRMGIDLSFSSAFHPQTNGQTERTNQTLETNLRCFVSADQDDWVSFLPLAEFALNNRASSATLVSPFFCNSGFHPRFSSGQVESSDCPGVDTVVDRLQQIWTHVVDNLTLSQEKAQRFANRRRRVGPQLRVGDLVWLSSRHIPMKVSSPKFKPRFIGPYRISEVLNPVSFRLTLPDSFSIHNVFHRSLLRRYVAPMVPSVDSPAPVLVEGELEYIVEKILDSRVSRRKLQYLVKWKGYAQEDNSWVFASDVHAPDLVRAFHVAHPGRPGGSACLIVLLEALGRKGCTSVPLVRHKMHLILHLLALLGAINVTFSSTTNCQVVYDCPKDYQEVFMKETITDVPKSISPKTTEIFLVQTGISTIRKDAFKYMGHLEKIYFMNNKISEIEVGAFYNLQNLSELELSANADLHAIKTGVFSNLTNLRKLVLKYNNISSLGQGIFDDLHNLEELYLNLNKLSSFPPGIFDALGKLKILHLAKNKLTQLPVDIFSKLLNLKVLRLYENELTELPQGLVDNNKNLTEFNMYNNRIKLWPPNFLSNLANLEKLLLDGNLLEELPNKMLFGLNKIKQLKMNANKLKMLPDEITDGINVIELDLSQNELTDIPATAFNNFRSLKKLVLSSNQITMLNKEIFLDLGRLTELNMEHNYLSSLQDDVFSSLPVLKTLRLNNNKFTIMPKPIDSVLKLTTIYLRNNSWNCDCNLKDFHNWINDNKQKVKDIKDILCESPDNFKGSVIISLKFDELICLTTPRTSLATTKAPIITTQPTTILTTLQVTTVRPQTTVLPTTLKTTILYTTLLPTTTRKTTVIPTTTITTTELTTGFTTLSILTPQETTFITTTTKKVTTPQMTTTMATTEQTTPQPTTTLKSTAPQKTTLIQTTTRELTTPQATTLMATSKLTTTQTTTMKLSTIQATTSLPTTIMETTSNHQTTSTVYTTHTEAATTLSTPSTFASTPRELTSLFTTQKTTTSVSSTCIPTSQTSTQGATLPTTAIFFINAISTESNLSASSTMTTTEIISDVTVREADGKGPDGHQNFYACNQGKHRVTKRGPALIYPMFTLVTQGPRHRWSLESCLCDSSPATTLRFTYDHGQVISLVVIVVYGRQSQCGKQTARDLTDTG